MTDLETLRAATEDDVAEAMTSVGAALPIADTATLAIVLGRMLGGPITQDDVGRALDGSYVSLPLATPAAVLEAFNRILDLKLGQGARTDE